MNKKLLLCCLIMGMASTKFATAQIEEEIKTAGQIYAYAQIHGDHEVLLDFTYPTLIEKIGGRDAMKNMLRQIHDTQKAKGLHLTSLKISDPIQSVRVKDEIHAIVPIVTTATVPGGLLITEGNLIAVGTNDRQNWYFIETTSLDERNISKVLPDWNHALTLPFKKPPVFKENKP